MSDTDAESNVTMPDGDANRVFISYSHDSDEHKERVLELADRLRSDGLDVELDQFHAEVTPRWMVQQIKDSRFVLVVCTEKYKRRFEGRETQAGFGADWEGKTLTQELYERRKDFNAIPILFDRQDSEHRPQILRDLTYFTVFKDYELLYRRLTDQHATPASPMGSKRRLPLTPRPGIAAALVPTKQQRGNPADLKANDALTPYRNWAKSHYAHLQLIGLDAGDVEVSLDQVFVPLKMVDRGRFGAEGFLGRHGLSSLDLLGQAGAQEEIEVQAALRAGQGHHLLIYGDPGSGKTTALKKLHQLCFQDPVALGLPAGTLPVFLRLRHLGKGLLEGGEGLASVLDREIEAISGTLKGMGELLWQHERLLLLFDGLDEIADEASRNLMMQRISWHLGTPKASKIRAVVSCRQASLPSADADREQQFRTLEMRPLKNDQIHHLVQVWFREVANTGQIKQSQADDRVATLKKALQSREGSAQKILELVSNPLLLTLLCVVVLRGSEIPKNRVRFYERCLEVLLDWWPEHKGCGGPLDLRSTLDALGHLAYFLHSLGRRDNLLWGEGLKVFKNVLGDRKTARGLLKWCVKDAGILTSATELEYGFVHLGVQEHLTAQHLAANPDGLQALSGAIDQRWWREVFLQLSALSEREGFAHLTERLLQETNVWEKGADLLRDCLAETAHPDLRAFEQVLVSAGPARKEAVLRLLGRQVSLSPALVQSIRNLKESPVESLATSASRLVESIESGSETTLRLCMIYGFKTDHGRAEELAAKQSGHCGGCDVQVVQGAGTEADETLEASSAGILLLGAAGGWLGLSELVSSFEDEEDEKPLLIVRLPGETRAEIPEELGKLPVLDWQLGEEDELSDRIFKWVEASPGPKQVLDEQAVLPLDAALSFGVEPEHEAFFVEPVTKETFLHVPRGSFEMGVDELFPESLAKNYRENRLEWVLNAPRPPHQVKMSDFWLAKTPVTNRQYGIFLEEAGDDDEPSEWRNRRFNGSDQPVVGVSWHQATSYCSWLTRKNEQGYRYFLPSEAQWEYSARGGQSWTYPWGASPEADETLADCGKDRATGQPASVGSLPAGAGPFGHLDMLGGVWEWCGDDWEEDYSRRMEGALDPIGGSDSGKRPLRGGSWFLSASHLRSAYRGWVEPVGRSDRLGFRVSCALSTS